MLDALLKDVCAALLLADVNVMLVQKLRNNVKKNVNINELGGGVNKKRVIQKVKIPFGMRRRAKGITSDQCNRLLWTNCTD